MHSNPLDLRKCAILIVNTLYFRECAPLIINVILCQKHDDSGRNLITQTRYSRRSMMIKKREKGQTNEISS